MIKVVVLIQLVSMGILGSALLGLLGGFISEVPVMISVILGISGLLAGMVSSSPLIKRTPLEEKIISEIRSGDGGLSRNDVENLVREFMESERVDDTIQSLIDRKIIVKKEKREGRAVEQRLKVRWRMNFV